MRSCHSVFTDQFIFRTVFVRAPGQPGKYVGEYKGIYWFLCPWGGENSRHCFSSKGRRRGNCKFCKIADGKHGDIMGIYRKKGFIKGEALRLLRTNSVRENFEQSKRDLERGYPLMPVQKTLTEVKFTDRNDALRSKTKQTKVFTVCYYAQYLQSSHTQSKKKIEKFLS